jgi:RND family efflux transporter MFP subunit
VSGEFKGFKEGDTVEKGEIVGQIEPGSLHYTLSQYEAELVKLQTSNRIGSVQQYELQSRKKNLVDVQQLVEKGFASKNSLNDLETAVNSLQFTVQLEEMELDYAIRRTEIQISQIKDQLERFTLRAPWKGVIMAPAFVEGDLVFAGNTVAKVTSTEKLIKVEINQDDLPAVRKSKRVLINFFSFPDKEYEGKVSMLVEIGNSSTQRFTVFVRPNTLPAQLLVGQTGEASFIADEHLNALLIPASALISDSIPGSGNVFVYNSVSKTLEKRKVKTGYISVTTVEVLAGLKEGEQVVYVDVDQQRDAIRVRPKL